MDVMDEMFKDPDLLAAMLAKGRTDREKTAIASKIASLLAEKGFITTTTPVRRAVPATIRESGEDTDILPEQKVDPALERARELLRQREEVSANPSPPVAPPTTQASSLAPLSPMNSGARSSPQLRQQYAALFPNDPISGMLNQQPRTFRRGGIASLTR